MSEATGEQTRAIWTSIDRITKPSKQAIVLDDGTTIYGVIPSLWDQSGNALTGSERDGTGPGGDPAERNPCDIDLMEIRGIIRDTTVDELRRFSVKPEGDTPAQLRRLASTVITKDPDKLWWWEYRFSSWGRLLATYLGEVDRSNHDRWLRNAPCPECHARGVMRPSEHDVGSRVWVPALVVEFRDGYIRGVACQACGVYVFRGDELWGLRDRLDTPIPPTVAEAM